ncbi:hypothetical protein BH23ACT9_BH23ACT9_06270 [soil metagenome]
MASSLSDRARDLLSALEILSRHRNADPETYRTVHQAATAVLDEVHAGLLDPCGGDLDAGLATYGELARQLRALPVPSRGQPKPPRGQPRPSVSDPFVTLLGKRFGPGAAIESWLSEVATGISPNVERAVFDGLRDLFTKPRGADVDVDEAGGDHESDDDGPAEDVWDGSA